MYTSSEKFHLHSAKKYLQYIESEYIRAFKCEEFAQLVQYNYAVLKSTKNTKEAINEAQKFLLQNNKQGIVCFHSSPDSLRIMEAKTAFEQNNFKVQTYYTSYYEQTAKPNNNIKLINCKIEIKENAQTKQEHALLKYAFNTSENANAALQLKLQNGAKLFFAYNKAGVPISVCMGEGYASAFCISDVYTPLPCRRQGCASAVVNAAVQYANKNGYREIFAYLHDRKYKKLFEQFGFRGKQIECYWAFNSEQIQNLPPLY